MALTPQARETFTRLFGVEPQPHPTDPELFDILQNGIFDEAFSTGGLDVARRELISLVAIAAIGATTQLRPHVAGAIRAGSSPPRRWPPPWFRSCPTSAAPTPCPAWSSWPATTRRLPQRPTAEKRVPVGRQPPRLLRLCGECQSAR